MKYSKIFSVFLASSVLSNSLIAVDEDQIGGLSRPLRKPKLSPLKGVDSSLIKGLRFHGKYSSDEAGFPAVEHNRLKKDDLPQDAVAALIQRLFPSPTHDVLAANNLVYDKLRKWLTPEAMAQLMVLISNHDAYSSRTEDQRLIGILGAISPGYRDKFRNLQKTKKSPDEVALLGEFKKYKTYEFASLLDKAIMTSIEQNHPNQLFYGADIVERTLFAYLWLQVSGKKGLKPYYDTLIKLGHIDEEDVPDYESRFSKEQYKVLKKDVKEERISLEEFLSNPELMLLYRYGFDLYEDKLPPAAEYRTVSYTDPDDETYTYSNCGEAALLSLVAALMFDPNLHAFDHRKLERLQIQGCSLKPSFISFLRESLASTASVNSTGTHKELVRLVSNLNTPDTTDEIRYRKHKGKVQKSRNGTYEIGAGLDNFLRIIGCMLGDPEWQTLQGETTEICKAISHNLTRICILFSLEGFELTWKNKASDDQVVKNPSSVNIVFSYNDTEWFNLDFGESHFKFGRIGDNARKHFSQIAQRILQAERPWSPTFALLISSFKSILNHEFQSPENFAAYLKGYLFAADLESLRGRTKALAAILAYKKKTNSNEFDFILGRWLRPKSEYFDEWSDEYTKYKVLNILAGSLSLEEICSFGVHEFNACFNPENWLTSFGAACSQERKNLGRLILEQPGAIETLAGMKIEVVWSDSDEEFTEEEMSGEESTGEPFAMSEEAEEDSSDKLTFSLLHGMAMLDIPEYMERAVELGEGVNSLGEDLDSAFNRESSTPLSTATRRNNKASVLKLLELGANPIITSSDGESPLDIALHFGYAEIAELLLERGLKPLKKIDGFSGNDPNLTIELLLKFNLSPEHFKALVDHKNCSKGNFKKVVRRHAKGFAGVFAELIPVIALRGEVEKLQILQEAGVKPIEYTTVPVASGIKMEVLTRVCLQLLDMGGDLRYLSYMLSELDEPNYVRVLSEAPKEILSELTNFPPTIKTSVDLAKVETRKKVGMGVYGIHFSPDPKLGSDEALKLLMECFGIGVTVYGLDSMEKSLFENILQQYPPERVQELAVCIPKLASDGNLERLQLLQKACVKPIECGSFFPFSEIGMELRAKVCSKLLEMGGNLNLFSFLITQLDGPSYAKVLSEVPKENVSELTNFPLTIKTSVDLAKVEGRKKVGVDIDFIHFSPYANLGPDETLKLLMACFDIGVTVYGLDSLEKSLFEYILKQYPSDRVQELAVFIPKLASQGSLEKLQLLQKACVKPIECSSFYSFSEIGMELRTKVCLKLLEMGGSLNVFSFLITQLDGPSYAKVLSEVPKENVSTLTNFPLAIKTSEDLVKIMACNKVGMKMYGIDFSPDAKLGPDETLKLLMACFDLGVTVFPNSVSLLSNDIFADLVEDYPIKRKQDLASLTPGVAQEGNLEKLRILRMGGVRIPSEASIYMEQKTPNILETMSELVRMGARFDQFTHTLLKLEKQTLLDLMKNIPSWHGEQLSSIRVSSLSELENLLVLVEQGRVGIKDIWCSFESEDFELSADTICKCPSEARDLAKKILSIIQPDKD